MLSPAAATLAPTHGELMMTAKEIAALARATNLSNDAQTTALHHAITDRAAVRHAAGESCACEDALVAAAESMRDAARAYLRALDDVAARSTSIAAQIRGGTSHATRSAFETADAIIGTPAHLGEVYSARARAWHAAIDLFEAVADLVRATPEEKAEALAKQDASIAAARPKRKKRA